VSAESEIETLFTTMPEMVSAFEKISHYLFHWVKLDDAMINNLQDNSR